MRTLMSLRQPRSLAHLIDLRMARFLAQRTREHAERRGHKMAIFAYDLIGIEINQFGLYERDELELLFAFLAPLDAEFSGGVALDIGANIGNHSLYFGQRFSRVYAFEPHPDACTLLRFNAQWSPGIEVFPFGLGSEAGQRELVEQPGNLGGSSLRATGPTFGRRLPIEVKRLDELDLELDRLCFAKIDVEGFEADVIEGGRSVIERAEPVIVLEQHLTEFSAGEPRAVRLLRELGYRFAWHRCPATPRTWLGRRWVDLVNMWRGRPHHIVTDDRVESQHHSMLIAVPPRFQHVLGV